jgi:flavin reductase (DIM6/NTAB) family NADH-FMN oxidoreductase RutF
MADSLHLTHDDILALEKGYRRNLINCLSGFKSLNLAGTLSPQGQTNLAVMSSVIHVGANPPLMGILFRPDVVPRHTLGNLQATGYFTLNHVTESIYQAAHQTSARYDETVSEFDATGLTPWFGELHPAPYVAESPVKIGLRFQEQHRILANATLLVVGRIVELMLPTTAVGEDGFLDLEATGTLTVSGLDSYHRSERIARLPYAKK